MKNLTQAAKTAIEIRKELKLSFPQTKFKVTSQTFAGGNSVYVEWTGLPEGEEIYRQLSKYEYGTFDAMTDGYNYNNCRNDIPQVKYLIVSRRD